MFRASKPFGLPSPRRKLPRGAETRRRRRGFSRVSSLQSKMPKRCGRNRPVSRERGRRRSVSRWLRRWIPDLGYGSRNHRGATTNAAEAVRVGGSVTAPRKRRRSDSGLSADRRRREASGNGSARGDNRRARKRGRPTIHAAPSPLLDQAAIDAVRRWKYEPTRLNGKPSLILMSVSVHFELQEDEAIVAGKGGGCRRTAFSFPSCCPRRSSSPGESAGNGLYLRSGERRERWRPSRCDGDRDELPRSSGRASRR